MPHKFSDLIARHQKTLSPLDCIKSGIKGLVALQILAWTTTMVDSQVMLASFGASCIIIFTLPHASFSQPANVVGGYLIAAVISVVLLKLLPHAWWLPGIMLGIIIATMAVLRVTHPPAGAVPLLAFYDADNIGFDFILFPCLSGSIMLVFIAIILHKMPPRPRQYPLRLDTE